MSTHAFDIAGLAAACCLLAACGGPATTDRGTRGYEGVMIAADGGGTPAARAGTGADLDDWGDDWLVGAEGPGSATPRRPAEPTIVWSIALGTYTGQGHEVRAATMLGELTKVSAKLGSAHVQTKDDGSTVVYGRYEDPQDPDAQRDLAWIKGLEIQGRPVFPRAMLTRFRSEIAPAARHPYDLMSARARFPKVDPLYTMDVAVWSDFDTGRLTPEQIRNSAEAYCMQLRTRGHEAYFLHDDDKQLSIVTVGLFDRRAIDMRSGFYSPEVDALFRQFPARLYNGEPLHELKDPERPKRGQQVQTPRLVVVPK